MITEIEIGSQVTAPITDTDGELSYVVGVLISMNSRYAKIDLGDGTVVNVGKSKIEPIEPKKNIKKTVKKITIECPSCDFEHTVLSDIGEFPCDECGELIELYETKGRIAEEYDYAPAKAASGRTSCDNGDKVASGLRGKTLEESYIIVSEIIGEGLGATKARYDHLNAGHQRMCLGNLLRGYYKRNTPS